MTQLNHEALRQLRRVVEAAPEEQFHMRACVEQTTCDTARCAFGWCIIDPWFRENTRVGDIPIDFDNWSFDFDLGIMTNAVFFEQIFGLTDKQSNILFARSASRCLYPHAITRKEVLANIDRLLNGEAPKPYKAIRPLRF